MTKAGTELHIKSGLHRFLSELLKTLPGKEFGQNVIAFDQFIRDVELNKAVSINEKGEVSVNLAELSSLNLPEGVRRILNYLGAQMGPSLVDSYASLFVDTYNEFRTSSKPAADIWLNQIIRERGGLLFAYGILNKIPQDIELPTVFKSLGPGAAYLFKEETPIKTYTLLKEAARYGSRAVCVSKLDPRKVRDRYGLKNVSMIWFTFGKTGETAIRPDKIDELKTLLSDADVGSFILMDCFEEIKIVNGFEKAMDLLKEMKDLCSENRLILLVSIDPRMFSADQLLTLEREFGGFKT